MQVQTVRFGTLEVDKDKVIAFPKGIPGFEQLRRFFMLPVEGAENIQWLQAVDEPDVALLVIDPFKYFKGYSCDLPDQVAEELEVEEAAEVLVLTTITVPPDNPAAATANLVAPIVINTRLRKGKQVILSGSDYSIKHRLFTEGEHGATDPKAGQAPEDSEKTAPMAAKNISGTGGV